MQKQPRPTNPQDAAYREGYAQGQTTERTKQENGVATGWLLGILFAALTALGIGVFYLTQREPAANTESPDINITQPQGTERETIIERTTEVVPAPSDLNIEAPDIDVDIPAPQPSEQSPAESAPAGEIEAEPSEDAPEGELEVEVPESPEQN